MQQKLAVCAQLALLMSLAASAQDIEKALNDQYGNQILVLRHSLVADSQQYDAQGNILTKSDEGSWTLYGRILVETIKVSADSIEVTGQRVTYSYDQEKKHFEAHKNPKDKRRSKVHIALEKPVSSPHDAVAEMGKVFALTKEDVLNSAPVFWRARLAEDLGVPYSGPSLSDGPPAASEAGPDDAVEKIDFRANNVTPPRVIYQPEPKFSKEARTANARGMVGLNIVVGRDGKVRNVELVKPLGMGLDEKAMEGVRAWRFEPAKVSGKPVAVQVYVEIEFRLFN